jgi:hypothetical protein
LEGEDLIIVKEAKQFCYEILSVGNGHLMSARIKQMEEAGYYFCKLHWIFTSSWFIHHFIMGRNNVKLMEVKLSGKWKGAKMLLLLKLKKGL